MKNQSKVGFVALCVAVLLANAVIHPVKALFLSTINFFHILLQVNRITSVSAFFVLSLVPLHS